MTWIADQFRLSGGLNTEDPQFLLPPGNLAGCQNYECLQGGGYKRVQGYERYDSSTAPHIGVTHLNMQFADGVAAPIRNTTIIRGRTSGKTATVVGTIILNSGNWATGDAVGSFAIINPTGTFNSNEAIEDSVTSNLLATLTDANLISSTDDLNYKTAKLDGQKYLRDSIVTVPGTGPVTGVFMIGGYVYAWRQHTTGNVQKLWKAISGGWTEITAATTMEFDTGTVEINEGDVITGTTSTAYCTVVRINVVEGNYAGPTFARGWLTVGTVSNGPFNTDEALTVSAVPVARTVSGGPTAKTFLAYNTSEGNRIARHETKLYNFYGSLDRLRIYGCDGVNHSYDFDGTYLVHNVTAMSPDTPTHLEIHRNHLFLTFAGGSLQNSGTGTPTSWSVRLGSDEIGIGDDSTGLLSNGNDQLAVFGLHSMSILHGTSNQDWSLTSVTDSIGNISYTHEEVAGESLFLDRSAVNKIGMGGPAGTVLVAVPLSRNVRKLLEEKASRAIDSFFTDKKSQYRLYFNDKTALIGTFYGPKLMGWSSCKYAHQFTCTTQGTDTNGNTRIFAGGDDIGTDAFVYELDVGTNFDGEQIESILQLPFNYKKSPDRDKRFHKITLEMNTPSEITLLLGIDYDYGNSQPGRYQNTGEISSDITDFLIFNEFFWDTNVLTAPEINIDGVGRSIGIAIYHIDAIDAAFTIESMLVQFSMWGIKR